MSRITREINKISMTVIGVSGRILLYALVIVLLLLGAEQGYEFGHSIFYSPGMEAAPGTDKNIRLTGEESVSEVGEILEENGLIRDPRAFVIQAFCYGYKVQAGDFSLNTSMASKDIIEILGETEDGET